jgi:hypothetical protein
MWNLFLCKEKLTWLRRHTVRTLLTWKASFHLIPAPLRLHFDLLVCCVSVSYRVVSFDFLCVTSVTWPCRLRRRYEAAGLLGLRVRIPLEAWMLVSCVCMLWCPVQVAVSANELTTCPEESYRVSKCMCDHRNPQRGAMFQLGICRKMNERL